MKEPEEGKLICINCVTYYMITSIREATDSFDYYDFDFKDSTEWSVTSLKYRYVFDNGCWRPKEEVDI